MSRRFTLLVLVSLLAATPLFAESAAPASEDEKTFYAMGLVISRGLAQFDLNEQELAVIQSGIADGALGREPKVALEEYGPKIDGLLQRRTEERAAKERTAGEEFLTVAAGEPGAQTLESGLVYREIEAGGGENPKPGDVVSLHYRGTLRDGSVFDTSRDTPDSAPASFSLGRVIPCFSEGVQRMKVGGRSVLTCPPDLAYGDRGSPPAVPPGATLQFEVELIEITTPVPPAPAAPAKPAEPAEAEVAPTP